MNRHFRPSANDNGFDGSVEPAYQMVPIGGVRTVRLENVGEATEFRVSNDHVSVARTPNGLSIMGLSVGTSYVQLLTPDEQEQMTRMGIHLSVAGRLLKCCVKEKRTYRIAYAFIDDESGQQTTRRDRSREKIEDLTNMVNGILRPQTNMEFTIHSVRNQTLQRKDSIGLALDSEDQNDWNALRQFDVSASDVINIYFVRNLVGRDLAAATLGGRTIAVQDMHTSGSSRRLEIGASVLAHEIVHCFDVEHVDEPSSGGRRSLMNEANQLVGLNAGRRRGYFNLSSAIIDRANPSGIVAIRRPESPGIQIQRPEY